jgi:hypothetical protein
LGAEWRGGREQKKALEQPQLHYSRALICRFSQFESSKVCDEKAIGQTIEKNILMISGFAATP